MGRTSLDDRWVITPCGGIDKIAAFLSLLVPNQLGIAVVTGALSVGKEPGVDTGGSRLLKQGQVLNMDAYAAKGEARIEGVIGRQAYIALVQQAYDLSPELMKSLSKPGREPISLVKEMEQFFTTFDQTTAGFNQYRPAEFLIQQSMQFDLPNMRQALDGFESLFRDLNTMLN